MAMSGPENNKRRALPGDIVLNRISRDDKGKPEVLGEGSEKITYAHANDKRKVIQEWHREGLKAYDPFWEEEVTIPHPDMTPAEASRFKRQFYLLKLLHLLFPDNIPATHAVGSEPRLMIRERFFGESKQTENHEGKEAFLNKLRDLGVPIDEDEYKGPNFLTSSDGKEVFIDTFLKDTRKSILQPFSAPSQEKELNMINMLESEVEATLAGEALEHARTCVKRFRLLLDNHSE